MRLEIPFCGPAYKDQSLFISPQECINFYLHPYPEAGESKMALVGTPGLELWVDLGNAALARGSLVFGNYLYIVVGNKLYQVYKNGTAATLGTIGTSTGRISISSNGLDVILVDGFSGYVYDIGAGTFSEIVDPDFPFGATNVVQVDGYYLANLPGTGQVWRSDFNDGTSWNGLAFSTAGGDPDPIISLLADHRDLYLVGSKTLEIWYNTGVGTFNFVRNEGAYIEQGGIGSHAICKANNAVYWIGRDESGQGQVFQAVGRQPKVVSTHPIDYALSGYDLDSAFAFPYQQLGHTFIVFTFPTDGVTWTYDSTLGLWYQRSSLYAGVAGEWRAYCHSVLDGHHIVGDKSTGKLYKLKTDVYTEDGTEIISTRTTSIMRAKQDRLTVDEIQIVTEPGVGLITGDAEDIDPQGLFSWSRDGGRNWSAEVDVPLGKIGETENSATVTQLGQGRNWAFRLRISAAVPRIILGAFAEVEKDD